MSVGTGSLIKKLCFKVQGNFKMNTKAGLDSALTSAIFQFNIRIDKASQRASVIDVIKNICNCNPAHAGEKLSRSGRDFTDRCAYIKINGRGHETPVADAETLVQIIWMIPGDGAKEFRLKSAEYVCRVLGADQSLAREIEMRNAVTPQAAKDFFTSKQAGAVAVFRRDTITISGVQVEVPSEDDPPAIKKWLQERLDEALADEKEERKSARDQRMRDLANESER